MLFFEDDGGHRFVGVCCYNLPVDLHNVAHDDDIKFVSDQLAGLSLGLRKKLIKKYISIRGNGEGETRRLRNTYLWKEKEKLAAICQLRDSLREIAKLISDSSANNKIIHIVEVGSDDDIRTTHSLLTQKKLKAAIHLQTISEKNIKNIVHEIFTDRNSVMCLLHPEIKKATNKLSTELALRKTIRKLIRQSVSYINMSLGIIGRGGSNYATSHEVDMRNVQKESWKLFGENTLMTRGDEEVSLLTIMNDASKKRFNELYVMLKGLEQYVAQNICGWDWAFITLTAPPEFHPNPVKGKNSWNGASPTDAHAWISDRYRKVGKLLRKKGIYLCGLKVVEPHRDACPHWHILVFNSTENLNIIKDQFQKVPCWDNSRGCKFELNNGTATAATYATKYIVKTISTIEKLEGVQGGVSAWRSAWAIRAFTFLGIPKLAIWRELRKIKERPEDALLEKLWVAANGDKDAQIAANAKEFIELAGGLNIKQKDRTVDIKVDRAGDEKITKFILLHSGNIIQYNEKKWERRSID